MKRLVVLTVGALVLAIVSPVAAGAAVTVAPTDLGTFGGAASDAYGVGDGLVVGIAGHADGTSSAFVYDVATETMTDIGTLGGSVAIARAVEGAIVVGSSQLANGYWSLFEYDTSGSSPMQALYLGDSLVSVGVNAFSGGILVGQAGSVVAYSYDLNPGGTGATNLGNFAGTDCIGICYSSAEDVSDGVVVGWADNKYQLHRAFEYDLNAASPALVDLGTLGGTSARAAAIEGDLVAGSSTTTGDAATHAFLYDRQTDTMTDIGNLGGTDTYVNAMDGGVIVGQSDTTGDAASHAFAYDVNTDTMLDLGTLGGTNSEALDVRGGVVVGSSQLAGNAGWHGFAYDLDTETMLDLGTLGGTDSWAAATDGELVVGQADTAVPNAGHAAVWNLPEATTTTVASSANPTVVGGQVTYTATVSPTPDGGTVAFRDGTDMIAGCAAKAVNTSTGQATCQVTYAAPGSHQITAAYSGSNAFLASVSSALTQEVGYTVTVLSPTRESKSGATVPVKLQLLDAAGNVVSSPSIAVTVAGLSPSPAPGIAPSGTFSYVIFESGPGYQLNVKTKGYPATTYTLSFTVQGDPTAHSLSFVLR